MPSYVVDTPSNATDAGVVQERDATTRELHALMIQSVLGLLVRIPANAPEAPNPVFPHRRMQTTLNQINRVSKPAKSNADMPIPAVRHTLDAESDVPAAPSAVDKRSEGPMTVRESSVLQLIGQGFSNKQIARQLNIAPETVKSHIKSIMSKLGACTRAHAVARAAKLSLLSEF
jgi:DNA-binding CsgD family transcriptional regulator